MLPYFRPSVIRRAIDLATAGPLHRVGFSTATRFYAEAASRLKKTGETSPYGPVGVAKALEASPSIRMPSPSTFPQQLTSNHHTSQLRSPLSFPMSFPLPTASRSSRAATVA